MLYYIYNFVQIILYQSFKNKLEFIIRDQVDNESVCLEFLISDLDFIVIKMIFM